MPKSTNSSIDIATGGTIDDMENTGMRLMAAGGVLDAGQGTATISMEKSFNAPKDNNFTPLGQISYDLNVTDSSDQAIKDFSGNVELTFEFAPTDLPTGINETDLNVMYFSNEANTYKECEGGVTVDEANNTLTCVVNHATTFSVVYPTSQVSSAGGGPSRRDSDDITTTVATTSGGGGGTPSISIPSDSNIATTDLTTSLSETVATAREISRPIAIDNAFITESGDSKVVQLTDANGSITLKPNKDSTISVQIPAETQVTGALAWDGKIEPPLIKPTTLIGTIGETIVGSANKLMRDNVATIVKVGSSESALNFNKEITLEVPVGLTDGTKLIVYSSHDGNNWASFNEGQVYTVEGGKVIIKTTHATYFAFALMGEGIVTVMHYSAPSDFYDIKGHWAEDYINQIVNRGIASGKRKGIFAPNDLITRAELTKIAVNAFGFEVPESLFSSPFKDIEINTWYAPYIYAAKIFELVKGYTDGEFRPNDFINRVEALKILLIGSDVDINPSLTVKYKDTKVDSWYTKYLAFAARNKIISGYGDGTFGPGNFITRAEVAKIVIKILEILK